MNAGPTNAAFTVISLDADPVDEIRRVVREQGCICTGGPMIVEQPVTDVEREHAESEDCVAASHFQVMHRPGCPALARTATN